MDYVQSAASREYDYGMLPIRIPDRRLDGSCRDGVLSSILIATPPNVLTFGAVASIWWGPRWNKPNQTHTSAIANTDFPSRF
jgi:hypothetical protein